MNMLDILDCNSLYLIIMTNINLISIFCLLKIMTLSTLAIMDHECSLLFFFPKDMSICTGCMHTQKSQYLQDAALEGKSREAAAGKTLQ